QARNNGTEPAILSYTRSRDPRDRRPGRAQREPGPITTGGGSRGPAFAGTTGGGRVGVVWPKCAARPRPHAEEHRSANGSTDAPTPSERCDASRSMRGCSVAILILRDARMRVRVCGTSSSACALLRMRTSIAYCIAHHLKQPISFPRRIFASGLCNFASLPPHRGVGGAPRNVRVLGGTPVRRALGASQDARERACDAARQAPSEAPCVP